MSLSSADFELHPRLKEDCHILGTLPGALLLLHRNAVLHWFILVPLSDSVDLLDLPGDERERLLDYATALHQLLREQLDYPRVNIGALGLVVPQLHLHVVGRRESDPCWPAPVWGNLSSPSRYAEEEVGVLRGRCADLFPRFA